MKKVSLGVAIASILACASVAFAAGTRDLPWNQSNIQTLRSLDKSAVVSLLDELWDYKPFSIPKARDIGEFLWADLAGDGRYELVVTQDVNGRAFFNALAIYSRGSTGEISTQEIDGWMISDLGKVIQDLNGDGKDELIIPTLFPLDGYGAEVVSTVWPAVYELRNGKYVEASKDFASFYEAKILPQVDKSISESRAKTTTEPADVRSLVAQTMERDKILRVLGRDPTAGLQEAYQWMNSDDPMLLQAAVSTFKDIGGHEQEKRAATEGWIRAHDREKAAR